MSTITVPGEGEVLATHTMGSNDPATGKLFPQVAYLLAAGGIPAPVSVANPLPVSVGGTITATIDTSEPLVVEFASAPAVTISGTATVAFASAQPVTVSGTATVAFASAQPVTVSGTVNVNVSNTAPIEVFEDIGDFNEKLVPGSISGGGTSQVATVVDATVTRLHVTNWSSQDLWIRRGGAAAVGVGRVIAPGRGVSVEGRGVCSVQWQIMGPTAGQGYQVEYYR